MTEAKKDPKLAMLLGLFPGLGFLYLENIKSFFMFFGITLLPLIGIGTMPMQSLLCMGVLYGISIYYTYIKAGETIRNTTIYKKDPYYILCLSIIFDGWGQLKLRNTKKAFLMGIFGLTPCILAFAFVIMKFGFMELALSVKGTIEYNIANIMLFWLCMAIPIKLLSAIDAFYSTYHLFVAKKD